MLLLSQQQCRRAHFPRGPSILPTAQSSTEYCCAHVCFMHQSGARTSAFEQPMTFQRVSDMGGACCLDSPVDCMHSSRTDFE